MTETTDSAGDSGDEQQRLTEAWNRTIEALSPGTRVWVYSARPLTLHGSTLIVAVPDDLTRTQLESRVRPRLEEALSATFGTCLLYTSPSPRDRTRPRMPSSA